MTGREEGAHLPMCVSSSLLAAQVCKNIIYWVVSTSTNFLHHQYCHVCWHIATSGCNSVNHVNQSLDGTVLALATGRCKNLEKHCDTIGPVSFPALNQWGRRALYILSGSYVMKYPSFCGVSLWMRLASTTSRSKVLHSWCCFPLF